ncbi:MAG: Ig-like domain-containing protein, partial [Solirubrobacteraceae bacterium]
PTAASAAAFEQCPHVDKDTGCQFLITVTGSGSPTVAEDASQGPYDGEDDTLVGIQNSSSTPVSSIPISSENDIFGFDGDGLCDPPEAPRPSKCVILANNEDHEVPTTKKPGTECEVNAAETDNVLEEPCGFEVAGEPAGLTSFGEGGAEAIGFSTSGDAVSGYEGPRVWFSNISSTNTSGTVNFSPALAPGEGTYFALEERLTGTSITIGNATTLATTLSGGGQSGNAITVVQGTPVTDTASLSGAGASVATGTVAYTVYSNPECTTVAAAAGSGTVAGVTAGGSSAVATLAPGTYYWRASYSGDLNNQAVSSTCGTAGEVLTVQAPTTTTTIQSGGGVIGASIPVLKGSAVTDQAHIAGAEAGSATGTVTYTLYKEAGCKTVLTSSVESVTGGIAAPSAPVSPSVGTYYWIATYSGGGLNAPSSSACGSEKLIVSTKTNLGLSSTGKKCFSKRAFTIHPRFPKGAKIVSYQEFINGNLVKQGKLNKNATSVSLIGLPKGAYKVELVTFTASGASYEDTRTFHTCVPKKHKHHH